MPSNIRCPYHFIFTFHSLKLPHIYTLTVINHIYSQLPPSKPPECFPSYLPPSFMYFLFNFLLLITHWIQLVLLMCTCMSGYPLECEWRPKVTFFKKSESFLWQLFCYGLALENPPVSMLKFWWARSCTGLVHILYLLWVDVYYIHIMLRSQHFTVPSCPKSLGCFVHECPISQYHLLGRPPWLYFIVFDSLFGTYWLHSCDFLLLNSSFPIPIDLFIIILLPIPHGLDVCS